MILEHANLLDYQKNQQQINWCRVTNSKNQVLNHSLPILNQLITGQRISTYNAYVDSSNIELGNTPQHFLINCFQELNKDSSIEEISVIDFSNMSTDEIVAQLDLLTIKVPFSFNQSMASIESKFISQRVPSKAVTASEDIWRYLDKVQIVALFEDTLKPSKEFLMNRIIHVLDELLNSIDQSDMISDLTNYDLSCTYLYDKNYSISFDSTNTDKLLTRKIKDLTNFVDDFTNLFNDYTYALIIDETFIKHIDTSDTIVAQLDHSTYEYIYKTNSHFDQSFILMKENIFGDNSSSLLSYIVPFYTEQILPDKLYMFFQTELDGPNEWAKNMNIYYGRYVRDILRFYFCFNEELTRLILQLIYAWVIRNNTENPLAAEITELLSDLLGTTFDTGVQQTNIIKSLEERINDVFTDMTGITEPIIYHTDKIDLTININNSWNQTLDDLYNLIGELNDVQFIYVFDMGYDKNLNFGSPVTMYSKNTNYSDSGYLSMFSSRNKLTL